MDNFFDRKIYLEILEKRIRDLKNGYRQNIALIGDELVGKTSIVFKFLSQYCDNRIIPLYLEIRPESFASFAKRFIGVLFYNFLINSGIPMKEDLYFLMEKSSKYIPKSVAKAGEILDALSRRKKNEMFSELLSLCECLNQETGKHCVVIWDEFHNLQNFNLKSLYSEWSKSLILKKNTMHILISSNKYKARMILSKNLSLLFGNFEIITVEPFDIKTSERYLEYRLQRSEIEGGLKNFIIHFTGGFPFYLHLLSESVLKSKNSDLVSLLEDLLVNPTGILYQKFSSYLKRFLDSSHSQDYISILYQISNGHTKTKDIAHILGRPKNDLNTRINNLLESDIIARNGDFLKINDRVFCFWLKFVYQQKFSSLIYDESSMKGLFRKGIEAMLKEFACNSQKPVRERVTELFHMFSDETIQIENKRLKLNQFREIKPLEFDGNAIKKGIIGRSNESLWIMAFKEDPLTEEDIADFIKECKKYRHKLQRKIIVVFADVETNARLKALEEKVWTWNLNSLNQIFDAYSKPRIIA